MPYTSKASSQQIAGEFTQTTSRWRAGCNPRCSARSMRSFATSEFRWRTRNSANPATRAPWRERWETRDEQIALTWYQMGEPLLVHTQPNTLPERPYGMCTVLIPAFGARLTCNAIDAQGKP